MHHTQESTCPEFPLLVGPSVGSFFPFPHYRRRLFVSLSLIPSSQLPHSTSSFPSFEHHCLSSQHFLVAKMINDVLDYPTRHSFLVARLQMSCNVLRMSVSRFESPLVLKFLPWMVFLLFYLCHWQSVLFLDGLLFSQVQRASDHFFFATSSLLVGFFFSSPPTNWWQLTPPFYPLPPPPYRTL